MGHFDAIALEPDALERMQVDAFTYPITSTKLLVASWQTRLGLSGRFEQRNPQQPMPLTNCTLYGTGQGSTAMLLDPSVVTYADPDATARARIDRLRTLPTRFIPLTGASKVAPLLPGAYGGFITHATCFNMAWIITRFCGSYGLNLWDEISDSAPQRYGDSLRVPISLAVAGEIESSAANTTANGNPLGGVCLVLCPKDWSAIPDTTAYLFRDDMMDCTALDPAVWTHTGGAEIDTTYQWTKITGTGWGGNGMFRAQPSGRGEAMLVNVHAPRSATTGPGIVGWSDGLGHSYSNMAHGLNFGGSGALNVYENGTARGQVGTYSPGGVYTVRITTTSSGAVYEIKGGKEYPAWTNVTPATTASATTTLYPGAAAFAGLYVGDFRTL
jgi:hypothetical protein